MIHNFEDFSWDYTPADDPYIDRQKSCFADYEDARPTEYKEVIFFDLLKEALVGVVQNSEGPPSACYDSSAALALLQKQHGLTAKDAMAALSQLISTDLGPSSPCFLDTSIIKDK